MRVRVWGSRGCAPASGPAFVRHGGNTTCLEVVDEAGSGRLVIDAGSGVVPLGRALLGGPAGRGAAELTLLLTHCHHDHILGFPFFGPIYVPGNVLRVRAMTHGRTSLYGVLDGLLHGNYSPLYSLKNLKATLDIADWDGGAFEVGALRVRGFALPHGPALASGLRVAAPGGTLAVLTDVEYPDAAALAAAAEQVRGADLVVHDAMLTPEEAARLRGLGHSSWQDAVRLAAAAGARRLVLTHHDPDRDDDAVDAIVTAAQAFARAQGANLEVVAAAEGAEHALGRS